jgi:hypothetical protein
MHGEWGARHWHNSYVATHNGNRDHNNPYGCCCCRFQRAVLKKGQLLKRGKAGTIFGDRYAVSIGRGAGRQLSGERSAFNTTTLTCSSASLRNAPFYKYLSCMFCHQLLSMPELRLPRSRHTTMQRKPHTAAAAHHQACNLHPHRHLLPPAQAAALPLSSSSC